jgi:polyhydroxyalkanoate synthesis regulator phasin
MANTLTNQATPEVAKDTTADQQRRAEALERLRRLEERIAARNHDLTEEQAQAIADEIVREIIDDLVARGEISFERDRR